jgi:hypothetical protein
MKKLLCFLGLFLLVACIVYAGQPPLDIDKSVPEEYRSDEKVRSLLSSIKQLQTRLDSFGTKHPARKQFQDRIVTQEESLRKRIQELTLKDSLKEDNRVEKDNPVASDQLDGTRGIDQQAYPWLSARAIKQAGAFFDCDSMWGIEPIYDPRGFETSGVIWKWTDCWWEKVRTEFWKSNKPIEAFHPSINFSKTKLWFVVIRDVNHGNPNGIEIWAYQGIPTDSSFKNQLLCRAKLESEIDSISLYFDTIQETLVVCVDGGIEIYQTCESINVRQGLPGAAYLELKNCFQKGLSKSSVEKLETTIVRGRAIVSGIASKDSAGKQRSLRPFWRKEGGDPSCTPDWWSQKGERIIKHRYQKERTPIENGKHLYDTVKKLVAGDFLLVEPGEYSYLGRLDLVLKGDSRSPIIIQGESPGVKITRLDASENVVNIKASKFFALNGIEVTGGSIGIRIEDANEVVICNSEIHHTGDVGIAINSKNTSGIYIVDNEIHHTSGYGEGVYAGSHDGNITTHSSFFVGNYIHDLASEPESQGDGIEIKDRSYGNIVKWNFIDGAKYPCITIYSTGDEKKPRNRVIENVVSNSLDSGIQVTGDAEVRCNWISDNRVGIVSKPFGRVAPRNLLIEGNTVLSETLDIKGTEWKRSDIIVANNFLYSKTRDYFNLGHGNALYLSNQLSSQLENNSDIRRIVERTQSRLVSENDIFGRFRPKNTCIGAVEYDVAFDHLGPTRGVHSANLAFAIWDSIHSKIHVMESTGNNALAIECQNSEGQRIELRSPNFFLIKVNFTSTQTALDKYLVFLVDRATGRLNSGESTFHDARVKLILNENQQDSFQHVTVCINTFGRLSHVKTQIAPIAPIPLFER